MVSHGRALAVAAAWIVVPSTGAAVATCVLAARSDGPWDPLAGALALGGLVVLTPLGLLAAAVVIARRAARTRSAAGLGAQGGLAGLLLVALCVAGAIATHQ
ncbi:hypothetical protein COUCH_25770 [Couchioplanes caeruleus]|uniref:hypothetical protein n=1 Tax=Couchioplanes caeruleus TaxID=56438 RepID=UPI0020BD9B54|nr:hypothetical protein [Couchioplanes caeruleus]UQU62430.1 hypothetical protein COUCH_25770 [Couchioplanes caeruleus]